MALFGFFKKTNSASEKEASKERAEDIIEMPIVPRQEERIETAQSKGVAQSGNKKAEARTIQAPNSDEGKRPEKGLKTSFATHGRQNAPCGFWRTHRFCRIVDVPVKGGR